MWSLDARLASLGQGGDAIKIWILIRFNLIGSESRPAFELDALRNVLSSLPHTDGHAAKTHRNLEAGLQAAHLENDAFFVL
jgi:hypothetical protein